MGRIIEGIKRYFRERAAKREAREEQARERVKRDKKFWELVENIMAERGISRLEAVKLVNREMMGFQQKDQRLNRREKSA